MLARSSAKHLLIAPAPWAKGRSRLYNFLTPWRWRGVSWRTRGGGYGYAFWLNGRFRWSLDSK